LVTLPLPLPLQLPDKLQEIGPRPLVPADAEYFQRTDVPLTSAVIVGAGSAP